MGMGSKMDFPLCFTPLPWHPSHPTQVAKFVTKCSTPASCFPSLEVFYVPNRYTRTQRHADFNYSGIMLVLIWNEWFFYSIFEGREIVCITGIVCSWPYTVVWCLGRRGWKCNKGTQSISHFYVDEYWIMLTRDIQEMNSYQICNQYKIFLLLGKKQSRRFHDLSLPALILPIMS